MTSSTFWYTRKVQMNGVWAGVSIPPIPPMTTGLASEPAVGMQAGDRRGQAAASLDIPAPAMPYFPPA